MSSELQELTLIQEFPLKTTKYRQFTSPLLILKKETIVAFFLYLRSQDFGTVQKKNDINVRLLPINIIYSLVSYCLIV